MSVSPDGQDALYQGAVADYGPALARLARGYEPDPQKCEDLVQEITMSVPVPGVHSDPEILGGTSVFIGTRVPVRTMFDYLEHDRPLAEFLEDFPTVERALAVGVLEHLKQVMGDTPAA